jgi:hypothetical protein
MTPPCVSVDMPKWAADLRAQMGLSADAPAKDMIEALRPLFLCRLATQSEGSATGSRLNQEG